MKRERCPHCGQFYPEESRSLKNHRDFMARVRAAWNNLPETEQDRFPTPDALRYDAAIRTEHYIPHTYACGSEIEAKWCMHWASRTIPGSEVEARVMDDGKWFVFVKQPKSTAFGAMSESEFKIVKRDILDDLSARIGIDLHTVPNDFLYAP